MGLKTLPMFEADLQLALGNRGFSVDQLDNWINTGLTDLTSQWEFEELDGMDSEVVLAGINTFTPAAIEGITGMANATNKLFMTRIEEPAWQRLDPLTKGQPKQWFRRAGDIFVWPTPNADTTFQIEKLATHPPLVGVSTTLLQSMWDRAVHLLAMAHALTDLEEAERSAFFFNSASRYIDKRIDLRKVDGRATGEPVQPIADPGSFQQLRRQRQFDVPIINE
jgi:hypothetical protein